MPDSTNIPRGLEIKISELPVASEVGADDQLEANQGGTSRRITISQIVQTVGAGASLTVSDTPPGTPVANMMWWSSQLGELFIWYDDGDSAQWVPATPPVEE